VRNRSGVDRQAVVPPAQRGESPSLRCTRFASSHNDGTCLTTHQHLHKNSSLVASTLYDGRGPYTQHSKRPPRLAMTRERTWAALRVAILSGIPNVRIALFLQCPASVRDILVAAHSRRAREIPFAREDIPDSTLRCASSAPPPGPDVISNISL
jgi:hypothetical protein